MSIMASGGRGVDTWWRLNGCVEPYFFNATQSLTNSVTRGLMRKYGLWFSLVTKQNNIVKLKSSYYLFCSLHLMTAHS